MLPNLRPWYEWAWASLSGALEGTAVPDEAPRMSGTSYPIQAQLNHQLTTEVTHAGPDQNCSTKSQAVKNKCFLDTKL